MLNATVVGRKGTVGSGGQATGFFLESRVRFVVVIVENIISFDFDFETVRSCLCQQPKLRLLMLLLLRLLGLRWLLVLLLVHLTGRVAL